MSDVKERDPLWLSLLWGRIGAAVLLLVAFVLQQFGYELTADEQVSIFDQIGNLIKDFGLLVAAAMAIWSKWRESKKPVAVPKAVWVFLALIPMVASTAFMTGCVGQTATQQIMKQTNDVGTIAKAAYLDAMGIYKVTAETHLRYKEHTAPGQNEKVKGLLNEMKAFLDDWKVLNGLARITAINAGSDEFHQMRRDIIFELADYIDKGGV